MALIWGLRPVYPDAGSLEAATPRGESYVHYPDRCLRENSQHVWTYIAWNEMFETWSKRSQISFDGEDGRGQELKMTLIRFLSSKGLRKDADGVMALTQEEIGWIESGIPTLTKSITGACDGGWLWCG